MNLRILLTFVLTTACLGLATVNSQAPQADGDSIAGALATMKAANAELLQRQEKTLKVLDELQAAAAQVKTLGKRS